MNSRLNIWFILRLVLPILMALYPLELSADPQFHFGWIECVLCSIVPPVLLVIILSRVKARSDNNLSDTYSLTKPFYPIARFPLRHWFTVSLGLLEMGAISSLWQLITHKNVSPIEAMFFLWGTLMVLVVVIFDSNLKSKAAS